MIVSADYQQQAGQDLSFEDPRDYVRRRGGSAAMKIEGEGTKNEAGEEQMFEGAKVKTRNTEQQPPRQRTAGNSFNRFEVERRNSSQRKKSCLQSERAQILAETYTTKERNFDSQIKSIVVRNSQSVKRKRTSTPKRREEALQLSFLNTSMGSPKEARTTTAAQMAASMDLSGTAGPKT